MIYLNFSELSGPLPEEKYREAMGLLPAEMQQAISRKVRWQDAHTSLLGKTMLLEALKGYGDFTLEDLSYNAFGRPQLNPPVDFSISHSENAVICGMSVQRIGVDLEKIKPIDLRDYERFLRPEEWEAITSSRQPERRFYTLWTQKEAVIKAVGEGLGLLTDIRIEGQWAEVRGEQWHLASIELGEDYAACVASRRELEIQLKVSCHQAVERPDKMLMR